MKYQEYLDDQAAILDREERQEAKDRFGEPPTYPTREGHFVERVDVVQAIRIAIGDK